MNYEEMDSQYAYDGELGAIYSKEETIFRVWSPTAESVTVNLYADSITERAPEVCPMQRVGNVWEARIRGDLDGTFYTYTVRIGGQEQEAADIYAKACGVNGRRSMVIDLARTNPQGWEDSAPVTLARTVDAVLYEIHVRDFSMDDHAGFERRGKYLAFTERSVNNSYGDTVGLDYIASLGVTHIHLLPVCDYQTVNESEFEPSYNWGYDPMHYFIPEGSYATDPFDGAVRIRELKSLILAAHRKGLGIVLDVVYNHTYATHDSNYNKLVPGYYYRHNGDGSFSNGSGCGNEIASERKMAGKLICDSLCYLAREYRLDGFRFDLMGLMDIQTLNHCAAKLREINPDILLYGEGWTGGGSPLPEHLRAVKWNVRQLDNIAVFSDDFRDNIKGNVFDERNCGYINGHHGHGMAERIKNLLCGGVWHPEAGIPSEGCWTNLPAKSVNYLEAHDNFTFRDKLVLSMTQSTEAQRVAAGKLGAALIFLSQGLPFIQAGQEFWRSKPRDGGGFVHDSYNSPDRINCIKWDDVTRCRNLSDYYRGLIAIRRTFPEFRMTDPDEIREYIHFQNLEDGALRAQIGAFTLILNPLGKDLYLELCGDVYADAERASVKPIYSVEGWVPVWSRSILLLRQS